MIYEDIYKDNSNVNQIKIESYTRMMKMWYDHNID